MEAMSELRRLYPGIRTHFISYRVASWSDTGLSSEDLQHSKTALYRQASWRFRWRSSSLGTAMRNVTTSWTQPTFTPTHEHIVLLPNSSFEKSGGTSKPTGESREG